MAQSRQDCYLRDSSLLGIVRQEPWTKSEPWPKSDGSLPVLPTCNLLVQVDAPRVLTAAARCLPVSCRYAARL